MPTGYTHDVGTGELTDFRAFALRCARAFGATVTQRDEDINIPPRHREVDPYYTAKVSEAEQELERYKAMSLDEAEAEMEAEHKQAIEHQRRTISERNAQRERYEQMAALAEAWEPPTEEHRELKDFMVNQLVESIDFDCNTSYIPKPPPRQPARDWLRDKVMMVESRLSNARSRLHEQEDNCAAANAWIDALYASLEESNA